MEGIRAGIITFHCADNFGALLQTYALKKYLRQKGIRADVVRYEPFFMTGRHWWIPYIPIHGLFGCIWLGWKGWVRNLRMGKAFFLRRANMRRFREQYLAGRKQRKILFCRQFRNLPYDHYIVGSDQIWNPDITLGLRKAYFGAFESRKKRKVISYAASIGTASLAPEFSPKFAEMLGHVDVVSIREREALRYLKQFGQDTATVLTDPSFLFGKEVWQKIEKLPDRKGFILVYMTEQNDNMRDYGKRLSRRKKLPVIELRSSTGISDAEFEVDRTAGPAEFLGYIHQADYVITNSLHGVVFSIIYRKAFVAFGHHTAGTRIDGVLHDYGMDERLCLGKEEYDIDAPIDWDRIEKRRKENIIAADEFIAEAL